MKMLYRHMSLIFAVLLAVACSGTVDPEGQPVGPDPEPDPEPDKEEVVPDGVLRIFADKTKITADGDDSVTFRVMFGSEDVSNARTMQLIREYDGNEKYMAYGANVFSTTTAGKYRFTAKYYYAGNHFTDNSVEIEAEQFFSGEEKSYAQQVLGVYFTSTGCTSCPSATRGIKTLQDNNPGVISVVAFHSHMGVVSDPMAIPQTEEFNNALGGFPGLPRLFWNMRTGTELIGPDFSESFAEETASYVPNCGVSVGTQLEGDELTVNVGITSNLPSVYRYLVFLVEDGIVADQSGDAGYVHNNVVRTVLTGTSGDKINDNLPLTVGVEAKAVEKVTLSKDWNVGNMRVIVAAMTSEDGGYNWVANNVNECKAGESVSYKYAE